MTGHSASTDPGVDVVRADLADVDLADRVFAPHYARGLRYTVVTPTPLHVSADPVAESVSLLAQGDVVEAFDFTGGWAWVRAGGHVGYLPAERIKLA